MFECLECLKFGRKKSRFWSLKRDSSSQQMYGVAGLQTRCTVSRMQQLKKQQLKKQHSELSCHTSR